MSKYEKLNEISEAQQRYLKASAVKDALTKLRDEHKDNFDEYANQAVGAAVLKALDEYGEAENDYYALKDEFEEDERGEGDGPWHDPESDLYLAEQSEQRGH